MSEVYSIVLGTYDAFELDSPFYHRAKILQKSIRWFSLFYCGERKIDKFMPLMNELQG